MPTCTQCGAPNDNGDSQVCRGCLVARNFPPAPTVDRGTPRTCAYWIRPQYQDKHGTTLYDVYEYLGPMIRVNSYVTLKQALSDYPRALVVADTERLLSLCHLAPNAVQMNTRDLEAAIRRLVDFAWEMTK